MEIELVSPSGLRHGLVPNMGVIEYAENVANNWMSLSEGVENNRICLMNELCILVM